MLFVDIIIFLMSRCLFTIGRSLTSLFRSLVSLTLALLCPKKRIVFPRKSDYVVELFHCVITMVPAILHDEDSSLLRLNDYETFVSLWLIVK